MRLRFNEKEYCIQYNSFKRKLKDHDFLEKARIILADIQKSEFVNSWQQFYLDNSFDIICGPDEADRIRACIYEEYGQKMTPFEFLTMGLK
jgi:hypothetical protein